MCSRSKVSWNVSKHICAQNESVMNLDESCHHMCVELGYKCDIHGVLSCDISVKVGCCTWCTTSSSQSTVESPNTVVDKTLCQNSRSRVSKKMSKPICAQKWHPDLKMYLQMSKLWRYDNFHLDLDCTFGCHKVRSRLYFWMSQS